MQLARLNRTLELSSALDNGRARLFVAVYDGKHRESKAFLYMDADNREHEVVERASPTAVCTRAAPCLVSLDAYLCAFAFALPAPRPRLTKAILASVILAGSLISP